jgi:WD40 repeat protein
VGQVPATLSSFPHVFEDEPPEVVDGQGKAGCVTIPRVPRYKNVPQKHTLKPGEEIELGRPELLLAPADWNGPPTKATLAAGPGTYKVRYTAVGWARAVFEAAGAVSTARVTLEIREADKPPDAAVDRHGDPLPASAVARLGTVRWRHGESVDCGALSPDGKLLAVGGNALRLFDTADGRVLRTLAGFPPRVTNVTFSPDGQTLLSSGLDGTLRLWDAKNGDPRRVLVERVRAVHQAAFSPDGRMIAAGVDAYPNHYLTLLDSWSGRELGRLDVDAYQVAFSPDGRFLATTGAFDRRAFLIDVAARRKVRELKVGADAVSNFAFAPDSRTLVTTPGFAEGARQWTLTFWALPAAEVSRTLAVPTSPRSGFLRYSPDGRRLMSSRALWDVATGEEARFPEGVGEVFAASADGEVLAGNRGNGVMGLWGRNKGKDVPAPADHVAAVALVTPLGDGKELMTLGDDGTRLTWDAATGQLLRRVPGARYWPHRFAVSADGRTLAGVPLQKKIVLYDLAAGGAPRELTAVKGGWSLALSADGGLLAVTPPGGEDNGPVRLVDTKRDVLIATLGADLEQPTAAAFSPDGKTLALGTGMGGLHLISVATGKRTGPAAFTRGPKTPLTVGKIRQVTFAPGGRQLVSIDQYCNVSLWELASGQERRRLAHQSSLAVFSPDGRLLATADGGHAVHLWDAVTGEDRARMRGHTGEVCSLSFSRDGTRLYSGSRDTTALVWEVPAARGKPADLSTEDLGARWEALAGDDATKAFDAVLSLVAAPQTVAFLRGRLKPAAAPDAARVRRLIADLDAEEFAARESATRELADLGGRAEEALAALLAGQPSAESRRRAADLLKKLREPDDMRLTGEALRQARAVEVLETVGDAQARELLAALAKGAPGANLTRAAQEALMRLTPRTGRPVPHRGSR